MTWCILAITLLTVSLGTQSVVAEGAIVKNQPLVIYRVQQSQETQIVPINQGYIVRTNGRGQETKISVQLISTNYELDVGIGDLSAQTTLALRKHELRSIDGTVAYSYTVYHDPEHLAYGFSIFSSGGKNYLGWVQDRQVYVVDVTHSNDPIESAVAFLKGRLTYYNKARAGELVLKPTAEQISEAMSREAVLLYGADSRPEIVPLQLLLEENDFQGSINAMIDEIGIDAIHVDDHGRLIVTVLTPGKANPSTCIHDKDGSWKLVK